MDKISGVYKITNKITGDFYIGSSCNIKQRWAVHKCVSAWESRPKKLYKDMAQYGLDNFLFEIIEETADLKEREQYWIEHLKPSYNNYWAKGWNSERHIKTNRQLKKEWYKIHRDERLTYIKAYHQANRDKELAKAKAYRSRLCLYKGETLTLQALSLRLMRRGIPHPTLEAKKYLISNHCRPNTPSQ